MRRVRLLAQDSTPVRLVMSSENLEVIAITHDVGKANESMDAQYEGEDLTVAFNPGYLIDGIEAATGEEVTLQTADAVKARPAPVSGKRELPLLADAGAGELNQRLVRMSHAAGGPNPAAGP